MRRAHVLRMVAAAFLGVGSAGIYQSIVVRSPRGWTYYQIGRAEAFRRPSVSCDAKLYDLGLSP